MVSMNEIHLIKDVTPPPYAKFRYKPLALRLKGMRKELGFDLADRKSTRLNSSHT